jgi:UPF0755 protein
LISLGVLAVALAAAWIGYAMLSPLTLPATPFEFEVKTGTTMKAMSRQLTQAGVLREPVTFEIVARAVGQGRALKAGSYALEGSLTAWDLLTKLTKGDVSLTELKFIEGWSFAQMRAAMNAHAGMRHETQGLSDTELMMQLGFSGQHPEGRFFPDTYYFSPGMSDVALLQRAHRMMQQHLDEAWATRASGLPYRNIDDALIMASIVEKETGRAEERPLIAGVFINRLRIGMRLQTDPTVIYGMGAQYDGNIRKRDLIADTPYNTYTRDGLPPTPIAMPGRAALLAATHPADTKALYFVARGNGSHQFSSSLAEHNQAVNKFQRHQ